MRWTNNMRRKLREKEKEMEREMINKYFLGVPALTKKKNIIFFLLLIMGPGFLLCALPALRKYFPLLQNKSSLFFIIFGIGMVSGLLARGFLKHLSDRWKDVLSNFMQQKPEPYWSGIRIIDNFLKRKSNFIISGYLFTLLIVFSGAADIDYNSIVFTFSRSASSKNSIIPVAGFIFFSFTWGLFNLWMILRIEYALSDIH